MSVRKGKMRGKWFKHHKDCIKKFKAANRRTIRAKYTFVCAYCGLTLDVALYSHTGNKGEMCEHCVAVREAAVVERHYSDKIAEVSNGNL